MLVMAVTRKSEGIMRVGRMLQEWGHQPTPSANARRPAASGLDARSMKQESVCGDAFK
jgi:hypothetical protein